MACSLSLLEATLAALSITDPNLRPKCQRSNCTVGNYKLQVLTKKMMYGMEEKCHLLFCIDFERLSRLLNSKLVEHSFKIDYCDNL